MIERILVPLDGSDLAETVLPYVDRLGRAIDCDVQLLSVADNDESKASAQEYLAEKRESLKGPRNVFSRVIPSASVVQGIIETADVWAADLITMSTHGRSGLARWAMGSVADRVIHSTSRPVLMVRSLPAEQRRGAALMNRMVVPLDGSHLSKSVLPYIIDLAVPIGGMITLVSVVEPLLAYSPYAAAISQAVVDGLEEDAGDFLSSAQEDVERAGLQATTEVRVGSTVDEILGAAKDSSAGMIAMATHGHSGLTRWLIGSVAEGVLRRTQLPCLIVRPNAVEGGRLD